MLIIADGRGTGKTDRIIRLSQQTGLPIVTQTNVCARYVKKIASEKYGFDPTVYTKNDVLNGKILGFDRRGVLIDDAHSIVEKALESYLGVPVKGISITIETDRE